LHHLWEPRVPAKDSYTKFVTQNWSYPCHRLIGARLVPDRAAADTQVVVHVPISQLRQMPGAAELEDAWLRARLGDSDPSGAVYLSGHDAEVAACDALTIPVVTGHAAMSVIDKIIALARGGPAGTSLSDDGWPGDGGLPGEGGSAGAREAHRYAIARLAVDFVSGPGGLASALRTGLLEHPYRTRHSPWTSGSRPRSRPTSAAR
jgi:hypothetical protein